MAITLDDLRPFEDFQGPVHVQHESGAFVAHGMARLEAGDTGQAFAPADVNLGVYNETRQLERLIPGAEILVVRSARPGWVVIVTDAVPAADGESVTTRGADPPQSS